ncbi:unnamed protein product [Mytilus coruscus]|uniref:Uncharacterized protein n=1 Tax=Mytilus coruscus TaxID=42192 RepID=A0A6J8ATJ6_MYTCO|nr:unnamed protein product [Mytilus coruscus]
MYTLNFLLFRQDFSIFWKNNVLGVQYHNRSSILSAILSIGLLSVFIVDQTVVIFNPVQERVIHTVTQLQGPNVNQHRVSYPQGYQQQYLMPNSHGQMMSWQFPGQVLLPMTQGSAESQQHYGMSNAGLSQQPWHMQSGLEQQTNQGVNSQQKS